MNLKIEKELFQWEKNRFVTLETTPEDPYISCVQFYNKKTKTSPEVLVINNKAAIPDYLLKENLPIMAVACSDDQVIFRREFKVLGRAKPDSYENNGGIGIEIIYDGGVEV